MEIVPEIEQEASKILRDLSNGRMDIDFKFGRETKTGKVTEELIVEAVDQGRSHPVSRYSGEERMRINLALRLGVSEAITRRSGYRGRIETLVIDEGFGALDESVPLRLASLLRSLNCAYRASTEKSLRLPSDQMLGRAWYRCLGNCRLICLSRSMI